MNYILTFAQHILMCNSSLDICILAIMCLSFIQISMLKIYENHNFIMRSSAIPVNQLMSLICTM